MRSSHEKVPIACATWCLTEKGERLDGAKTDQSAAAWTGFLLARGAVRLREVDDSQDPRGARISRVPPVTLPTAGLQR